MKLIKKHRKIIEDEYDSHFKDYEDVNQDEKPKYANDKLSKLPIHDKIKKLNLNEVGMIYDGNSLCPFGMWDEKSVYPKIESGFAFKSHMNDVYVKTFNIQTFNQDVNESAILEMKYYNQPDLVFQRLPIEEKVKNFEVN